MNIYCIYCQKNKLIGSLFRETENYSLNLFFDKHNNGRIIYKFENNDTIHFYYKIFKNNKIIFYSQKGRYKSIHFYKFKNNQLKFNPIVCCKEEEDLIDGINFIKSD